MPGFGVVVLAAGGSRRLGSPKQLAEFQGERLVARAARISHESSAAQVIVVVGFASERVRAVLGDAVQTVESPDWEDGIGSSIACGVSAIQPDLNAVVILPCDMPLVTPDHLTRLAIAVLDGPHSVAASKYEGVLGPPCAFPKSSFPALRLLSGDVGARNLIRSSESVAEFDLGAGSLDIDSPADVERLRRAENLATTNPSGEAATPGVTSRDP